MNYTFTNQKSLRAAFWEANEKFQSARRAKKKQNSYNAEIRQTWVEFIDYLEKSGQISEKLAFRATL